MSHSIKFVKIITPLALAIALAACGGGSSSFGDGGTSNGDSGEKVELVKKVESIDIVPDATKLLSDGSQVITIKVHAKDVDGVAINDASYKFSVNKGATLIVSGDTAILSPGSAKLDDELTVSVQSGDKTQSISVNIVKNNGQGLGTEGINPDLISKIRVSASASKILADGTKVVIITAVAKDKNNNVISGIPVEFLVDKEGEIKPTELNVAELKPGATSVNERLTVTAQIKKSTGEIIVKDTMIITVVDTIDEVKSQVSSLDFTASSLQLMSSGKDPVTLSAIIKDKYNNIISNENVIFSVDNGGTISVDEEINKGIIKTAALTPGSSKANRTLKVKAVAGGLDPIEILINIIGTRLNIEGSSSITINKPVEYILKLQDSANQAIASTEVVFSTDFGTVTSESNKTDTNGEIKVTLNAITNGTANIKAEALNATATKQVLISGNDFSLSGTDLNNDGIVDAKDFELRLGHPEKIIVKMLVNGIAQKNKVILIRATRGSLFEPDGVTPLASSAVETNEKGEATFSIKSNTAGTATIIAETKEGGVTTTLSREFVAITPAYLTVLASPTLVAPTKSSAIIARVRDVHDNPVKNIAINFNLEDTVNGELSSAKAITDSLGRAEVTYTAGNSSSALNGVSIKTTLENTLFNIDDEVATLTVGGNAIRLTLGHDQLVGVDEVFYIKKFGVIVTDSAGNPVKDKKISFKITPKRFFKGYLTYNPIKKVWVQNVVAACASEDVDDDGNLDAGEDINSNKMLDPTHDATVTSSGVTDEKGKVAIEVIYPKNTSWWSEQRIESTTAVNGTEYKEYTNFILPALATDVSNEKSVPPNILSPYGTWGTCSDNPDAVAPNPEAEPPKIELVYSDTSSIASEVRNSKSSILWYAITIDGKRAEKDVDYTIETSDKVSLVDGPYNDFKLIDNDSDKDESGFYISVKSIITSDRPISATKPIFYRDNAVGGSKPIITLNGSDIRYLNQGSTYNELGANAIDNNGKILDVNIFGAVNTNKPGVYTIIYRVTDQFGTSSSIIRTIIVKDSDVPVITINGSNPLQINIGGNYTELGASAIDDTDGDITTSIQIEGTVDTTISGTYYISYNVTDSSGNKGVETRTVIVDGAPVLTLNGDSEMTVAQNGTYIESGAVAEDAIDGDISANIQITGNVDTAVSGTYIITYAVTDSSGYTSQKMRTITVADGAPVLTLQGNATIIVAQNSAYIEPGASAIDVTDGDISANIQIDGNVDITTPATYSINYSITDSTGNEATKTRTVIVDGAPTLTLNGSTTITIAQNSTYIEPGAVAADALDGDISANIQISGTVDTAFPATYYINYSIVDSAGNTTAKTRTVVVDGAPTLTLNGSATITIAQNSSYTELGATAQDGADGNVSASIQITGTVDTATVGAYTITYTVTDSHGLSTTKTRTVTVQ